MEFFKNQIDYNRASFIRHTDGKAFGFWVNVCGDHYDVWWKEWDHNTEMMVVKGKHFTITYKARPKIRSKDLETLAELKVKYFHQNRAEDAMTNLLVAST